MKNWKILFAVAVICSFTSCATFDKIASIFKGDSEASSSGGKPITPKGYALPENYETANLYRTDKPWDVAKKIPKNMNNKSKRLCKTDLRSYFRKHPKRF